MATKIPAENPLSGFVRLSSSVYLKEPTSKLGSNTALPSTIVLSSWVNAPPKVFTKFVNEYVRLAPSSRIIFIFNTTSDYFRGDADLRLRLMPAVETIRASTSPGESVFLHIFSNGGSFYAMSLLKEYRQATGSALFVPSIVFDSAPGRFSIQGSAKALSYALPKTPVLYQLGLGIVYAFFIFHWLFNKIFGKESMESLSRQALNDPELFGVSNVAHQAAVKRRCYIYSDSDELILPEDVEDHAAEAESRGWIVEREKFHGSPHVAHMRTDPERYWAIVSRYLRQI